MENEDNEENLEYKMSELGSTMETLQKNISFLHYSGIEPLTMKISSLDSRLEELNSTLNKVDSRLEKLEVIIKRLHLR